MSYNQLGQIYLQTRYSVIYIYIYIQLTLIQGEWSTEKGTAGGSPNVDTFTSNPQYALSVSKATDMLLELIVPDIADAQGFLVVKRKGIFL